MTYKVKVKNSKDEWDKISSSGVDHNFLQSSAWGEVKGAGEWQSKTLIVETGGATQATFLLLTRTIKHLVVVGYIPNGPIFINQEVDVLEVLEAIKKYCLSTGLDQLIVDSALDKNSSLGKTYEEAVINSGFTRRKWIQRPNTGVIDLSDIKSLDDVKSRVSKRRRTTVNKLIRDDNYRLEVGCNQVLLDDFLQLHRETANVKGFTPRGVKYYNCIIENFSSNKYGEVFFMVAYRNSDDLPVSAGCFIGFGRVLTYYSGASSTDRKLSEVSSLLQLEAMIEAVKRGYKVYDFWGAPDSPDDPEDPFYNVWIFKKSLGAELFETNGCWQQPLTTRGALMVRAFQIKGYLSPVINRIVRFFR